MKKVLVALSGGIDSAATALILWERNYRVTAVTFDLTGDAEAIERTSALAERLKIPLIVEDLREEFDREVVGYFTDGYLRGETPAPCSRCNPCIKWAALKQVADREGIPLIATGHYVRIVRQDGFHYVAKGIDPVKDQSYYLWDLDQEILRRAVTPLGDFTKGQVRELMELWGYGDLNQRRESMGVCFLDKDGYAKLLRQRIPEIEKLTGGEIVTPDGQVIGTHEGYPFYTIGQKRGFELSIPGDWYVTAIDAAANRLTVGPPKDLWTDTLLVRDYRIINPDEFFATDKLEIKVRGLGINPEGYCTVEKREDDFLIVQVPSKAYAPAPGQPVVFYLGDRVVGGGILNR